jgi:hypothetical protein
LLYGSLVLREYPLVLDLTQKNYLVVFSKKIIWLFFLTEGLSLMLSISKLFNSGRFFQTQKSSNPIPKPNPISCPH